MSYSKNPNKLPKQKTHSYKASNVNQNRQLDEYDPKYKNKVTDSNLKLLPTTNKDSKPEKLMGDEKSKNKPQLAQTSMNSKASKLKKKKFNPPTVDQNYRTSMCKKFEENKIWRNKIKCNDAHGEKELRKYDDPYPEEYIKRIENSRK